MRWFILWLSAFIIEICSTLYMWFVADKNVPGMIFFASLGPFLGLPFVGYMVESKTWIERIKMACVCSFGYMCGSLVVILINKYYGL
jgi:hypothetical protein